MPEADRAYPYKGSKTLMVVVEDATNTKLMTDVLNGMYSELSDRKKKKY